MVINKKVNSQLRSLTFFQSFLFRIFMLLLFHYLSINRYLFFVLISSTWWYSLFIQGNQNRMVWWFILALFLMALDENIFFPIASFRPTFCYYNSLFMLYKLAIVPLPSYCISLNEMLHAAVCVGQTKTTRVQLPQKETRQQQWFCVGWLDHSSICRWRM